jgi:hypothetical protein
VIIPNRHWKHPCSCFITIRAHLHTTISPPTIIKRICTYHSSDPFDPLNVLCCKPVNIPIMSPTKQSPRGKKKEGLTKKAPGAPKRFKSSYILFFMHVQEEIKKSLPPGTHTVREETRLHSLLRKKRFLF